MAGKERKVPRRRYARRYNTKCKSDFTQDLKLMK